LEACTESGKVPRQRKPGLSAMQLTYHVLDVFTDTRFGGNPLAVVLDADGLDPQRMQTVAREFNLSETVFVLTPQNATHTARVRIFTPASELPFAGHPTVGAAALLAELRSGLRSETGATAPPGDALIVLEEAIGIVRAGVRLRPGAPPYAEFAAPRLPAEAGTLAPPERLAAALGLIPAEIGFENHRPTRYTAGVPFAFIPVASLEAIAKARVAQPHWDEALKGQGLAGTFLYCRQTRHTTSSFHARLFAPHMGIPEDPATGSAAAAFAGVVQRFDSPPDGHHKRLIEQGYEMGRPSLIALTMEVDRARLAAVRIGGHAVRVAEGRIEV
jgi:trans-2,3-dihydro-3-hydroxyanthranilate isomerase